MPRAEGNPGTDAPATVCPADRSRRDRAAGFFGAARFAFRPLPAITLVSCHDTTGFFFQPEFS